jgi:MinD-like ATPase involved in chromosome partitioning or flagellar assembly
MKNRITFDTSLIIFVRTLLNDFDKSVLEAGWILRDASGHLTFISVVPLTDDVLIKANIRLKKSMSFYCREDSILQIDQPGVRRVIESAKWIYETVLDKNKKINLDTKIRYIDRRIVGRDWLTSPVAGWQLPEPARIVFASLKGGVGRSTGLTVVASELASQGKNVLAIDFDLEAPGIGTMLLRREDRPRFGVLDWFVERGIYGSGDVLNLFIEEMIAVSPFSSGNGLIHVVPAVGFMTDDNPSNALSKIARAYLELPQDNGPALGFLAQTQELIRQLSALNPYDVILIDARAGLNESTAAALLGLGADVLLFGIDTPQTFTSYRYLLAHLARFSRNEDDDWLYRFKMIHAKASRDKEKQKAFRDRAYQIFEELLYDNVPLIDANGLPIFDKDKNILTKKEFGLTEPTGPHYAWSILSDANFSEFDPCNNEPQMKPEFYRSTYDGLIQGIEGLISNLGEQN